MRSQAAERQRQEEERKSQQWVDINDFRALHQQERMLKEMEAEQIAA